jgi:Ca-activated chloride channel homolog
MSALAPAIYIMSDDEIQKIYCVQGSSPMMTATTATAMGVQVGFPLVALDLDITVVGFTASMEVTQTFFNRGSEPMEATYIFPLPDRLAVTRFRMDVAGRIIEGVINERGAAREMYDQAIAQGQRAAIAEEERPGVFTLRVGNVMPGEMPVVRLSLIGPLAVDGNEVTLQFPLLVAPRYTAGQRDHREWAQQTGDGEAFDTDVVPDASRIAPPVRIAGHHQQVRLSGRFMIDGVTAISNVSSSLPMLTSPADGALRLALAAGAELNRDLILRWRMVSDTSSLDVSSSLVLVDDIGGGESGTFALTLVPPSAMVGMQKPRDVVFIIDRSGSMRGWQMVAARRAVARMVDSLTAHDRFTVIAFDDFQESPIFENGIKLAAASDRNRFLAVEFLAKVDARGGTDMARPLKAAAEMLANVSATRDRTIVIVTDGQVSGEDSILASLASQLRGTRVMTIGIDQSVNAAFLRRLAALGAGLCELVESEDRLDQVMNKVHCRIGLPVVQHLSLKGAGFL